MEIELKERVVQSFTANLLHNTHLNSLCESSLAQLCEVSAAASGAVLINRSGTLDLVACHGDPFTVDLAASPVVTRAFDQMDPSYHVFDHGQGLKVMLVPLVFQGIGLGVVVLADNEGKHNKGRTEEQGPEVIELITTLCNILSLAINNSLVLQELDQLASLDPLSGLLNHRLGMQRLNEEIARAKRTKTRIGLLIVDLDNFKTVNDSYGRVIGDQLLSAVAWGLQEIVRGGDVLAHCSGGTFMVVTTNASGPDVSRVAERVRRQIANTVIAAKNGSEITPVSATASVGCVSFPDHPAQDCDAMFAAASEALTFAKETGRDRVMVAGRLNVVAMSTRSSKGPADHAG